MTTSPNREPYDGRIDHLRAYLRDTYGGHAADVDLDELAAKLHPHVEQIAMAGLVAYKRRELGLGDGGLGPKPKGGKRS